MDYFNTSKPPLGVMPKEIYEIQRIQELCKALYDYSISNAINIKDKKELMSGWVEELNERIWSL